MRTIWVFKGLPGSGKSSLAAEMIKKEPGRWIRINRDDLRGMVVGPGNNPYGAGRNEREDLVRNLKNELIRQALREGYDVILDDTHLVPQTVKKIHELALTVGDIKVIERGVNVSVEECIRRDALRTGFAKVGEKVIKDMAQGCGVSKGRKLSDKEAYYPPRWAPGGGGDNGMGYTDDPSLITTIDCDLDGTTSLLNGRSPYDASSCDKDPPNTPVIECIKGMYAYLMVRAAAEKKNPHAVKILFTSGREEKYREPTERFLAEHLPGIPYELHMRKTGDMRKDAIIKREMFDNEIKGKWNILFVLDDRNQVVDNWREMGLHCFQVAPGNF
jgi:predicted kinase